MKHEKMMFAGVEMDIVIGHPEHELLFVGSQVEKAAGLTKGAIKDAMKRDSNLAQGIRYQELKKTRGVAKTLLSLTDVLGKSLRVDAWFIAEPAVYGILLRGHAPQSEPFRKWVTTEVLTSIRKTGVYDIAKSNTAEASQFTEEFSQMRGAIQTLTAEVISLKEIIAGLKTEGIAQVQAPAAPAEVSPYEGQKAATVTQMFNNKLYREQAALVLSDKVLRKVEGLAVTEMERMMLKVWKDEDGRALRNSVSVKGRHWTMFPEAFLTRAMSNQKYREAALSALDVAMS